MCPYSDVEFAILIFDEKHKNYFRVLSQILECKILNLGETSFKLIRQKKGGQPAQEVSIIRSGFSMDIGGLSPRGKQGVYELIGTPEELAKFQTFQWQQQNESEIILINAMARPSFIMGDPQLAEKYKQITHKSLDKKIENQRYRKKRALALLEGHIDEFKPYLTENRIQIAAFNVKKDLYRPFQMILESLSLYYNLTSISSADRIEELRHKKLISDAGAGNLRMALDSAIKLRIQLQLYFRGENETMTMHPLEDNNPSFLIGDEETLQITEIYRVMIPYHEAAIQFVKGNTNTFKASDFYERVIAKAQKDLAFREAVDLIDSSELIDKNSNIVGRLYAKVVGKKLVRSRIYEKIYSSVIGSELTSLLFKVNRNADLGTEAFYLQRASMNPDSTTYLALGRFKSRAKDYAKALEYFQKAVDLTAENKNNPDQLERLKCLNSLADGYLQNSQMELALELYQQVLAAAEEHQKQILNQFFSSMESEYKGMGSNLFKEESKSEEKVHVKSSVRSGIKSIITSMSKFKDSMYINTNLTVIKSDSLVGIGNIYFKSERIDDAIAMYEKACLPLGQFGMSEFLEYFFKFGEADTDLNTESLPESESEAIDLSEDPNKPSNDLEGNPILSIKMPSLSLATVYGRLGIAYETTGQNELAIRYYNKALKMCRSRFCHASDASYPFKAEIEERLRVLTAQ